MNYIWQMILTVLAPLIGRKVAKEVQKIIIKSRRDKDGNWVATCPCCGRELAAPDAYFMTRCEFLCCGKSYQTSKMVDKGGKMEIEVVV